MKREEVDSNKTRKAYLVRRGLVDCGLCPYHRKENGYAKKCRSDRYKTQRKGK